MYERCVVGDSCRKVALGKSCRGTALVALEEGGES